MQRIIGSVLFFLCVTGCKTDEGASPYYIKLAAEHCDCRQREVDWLRPIITSGDYPTPGATLPAPIRRIFLSSYANTPLFILDSDVNNCSYCPWAILDCSGKPFTSKLSSFPLRDKLLWESY